MHPLTFTLKRAYWRSQLAMRTTFRAHRLTPARFDLMFTIASAERALQPALARMLGVCAKTVSVMLGALEDLGFVVRRRDTADRRRNVVSLTPRGRRLLRAAQEAVLDRQAGRDFVAHMLRAPVARVLAIARPLARILRTAETQLGGWSTPVPPWPAP